MTSLEMTNFEMRPSTMLRGLVSLRLHQTRWFVAEWARMFGLMPSSGKWTERISFLYIYLLVIGILTPSVVNLLAGLYAAEAKTAPALQAIILQFTIPWIIAVLSVVFVANPWKAWLLRLTFGDITYLSPSSFDRRVLSMWRYLEMVAAVPLLIILPVVLAAPMFGSIWAVDLIPNILRALLAIGLWAAPMLALGWHVSLQQYARDPLSSGVHLIARLAIVGVAGALAVLRPEVLLWPGRLIVLMAMGNVTWAWPMLFAFSLIGVAVVWRAATHLSLTRASAASDVFARIQQLGIMIFLDRQLLLSILSDARASESYASGTLPNAMGLSTVFARGALHYRRRSGQAIQLFLAGILCGAALLLWRPTNVVVVVVTAITLAFLLPPWLSDLFRRDMTVPFMMQFIPQPLTRRLLAASVVPTVIVLAGMIPVVFALGPLMPDWAWGIIPAIWVLSLYGHVEAVGKGSAPGDRNIFSVLLGSLAVFLVIWSATTGGMTGITSLAPGLVTAAGVSLALLMFADFRHSGLPTA